ncbi:MAG: histidine phosphatase family protein [Pyrinomonadaceae bacterium]|nr:histidine phosphatase family protein [Pyrinomonadaceae bacterium]
MKTLLIMRHAKSSWDNPDWSDFERPLNKRGLKTAPFMGSIIYTNNIRPDLIISSPAKRAKQTAVLVKETAQVEKAIQFEDKIYEASATTLLYLATEFSDKYETILIIGHNPGIEEFIRLLTGDYCSMPTASLAKILVNVDSWREIALNKGFLETVFRPKDLMNNNEEEAFST